MKTGVEWAFRWKTGVRFFVRAQKKSGQRRVSILQNQISVKNHLKKEGGDRPVDLDYAMRVSDPYLFRENTAEPDTFGGTICRPYEHLVFKTRCPPGLGHLIPCL